MSSDRGKGWRRRTAVVGLGLVACGVLGAPAAADGGHLPGFSVADQRVAIKDLPEGLAFTFGGFPGMKGTGLPHAGHGPVWFGEVQRPKRTIYVTGNRRWVCASETRPGEGIGSTSCTSPAGAREFGLVGVGACSKGPPRHFRVFALLPDGVDTVDLERPGGILRRRLPVIDNTIAFTVGRENITLHATGEPEVEELERILPLARAGKHFGDHERGGCSFYTFFEAKKSDRRAAE